MFKFELFADSAEELNEKLLKFAASYADLDQPKLPNFDHVVGTMTAPPVFIPEQFAPPVRVEKVVLDPNEELDVRGKPWNEKIHSLAKTKNKDGTWRYKKGVDDSVVKQVEDATPIAAPVQVIIPPPPAPTIAVEIPKFPNTTPQTPSLDPNHFPPLTAVVNPVAVPSQPAPKYEEIQVPESTRPAHSIVTFKNNLVMILTQLINEGKITTPYVGELVAYFGVKDIWNLAGDEAKCLELFNTFVSLNFITRVDQ